jgi:predicted nuclease with RNAse H fold
MSDVVIGIDPGGEGKNGIALIFLNDNKIIDIKVENQKSINTMMRWLEKSIGIEDTVVAIGIDSFLSWSSYRCCWRPMDRYLRLKYKQVKKSVLCINGAYGSMVAQGAMVAEMLLRKFPGALINETHPKVAYYAETNKVYKLFKNAPSKAMRSFLTNKIKHVGNLNKYSKTFLPVNCSEHEWDAVYSAVFTLEHGLRKEFPNNLVRNRFNLYHISQGIGNHYFWVKGTKVRSGGNS